MFNDNEIKLLGNNPQNTPLKVIQQDLQDKTEIIEKEDFDYKCSKKLFVDYIEPLIIINSYIQEGNDIYKVIKVDKYSEHLEVNCFYCDYKEITINDNTEIKKALFDETTQQVNSKDEKILITSFEVGVGDYIIHNNNKYMVISQLVKDSDSYRSRIVKCDQTIKLYIDNKLYEYPCIPEISSTQNPKEGTEMSVVDGNVNFIIPNNSISKNVKTNTRLIKWEEAWQVVSRTMAIDGLLKLYCKRDVVGGDDDLINEIADRYKHETKHTYRIVINNKENSLIGGETLQLNLSVYDNNVIVETKDLPTLLYTSSDDTIAIVDDKGLITTVKNGDTAIKVTIKDLDVSSSINLNVIEANIVEYRWTKFKDVINIKSDTPVVFEVYKFVNNVQQTDKFTFKLNYNNKPKTICTIISFTDNSINLSTKDNRKMDSAIVKLEVYDSNNIMIATKDIKIKFI